MNEEKASSTRRVSSKASRRGARVGEPTRDPSVPNRKTIRRSLAGGGIIGWYIAAAGSEFYSEPLTDKETSIARAAIGQRVFEKGCFHNAQRIVLADKTRTLKYVEGYRFGWLGPLHHAWATINRKVVDTTPPARPLRETGLTLTGYDVMPMADAPILGSFDSKTLLYVGVSLPPNVFSRRRGGSALDDWKRNFPVIRAFERSTGKKYPPKHPPLRSRVPTKREAAESKKRQASAERAAKRLQGPTFRALVDATARSSRMDCMRFRSARLTVAERAVADAAMASCRAGFKIRECFYNAKRLVRADKTHQLEYCEGAAFSTGSWYPHAWASIGGKVVDPTGPKGVGELEPLNVARRKVQALGHKNPGAVEAQRSFTTRVFGVLESETHRATYVGRVLAREDADRSRDRSSRYGMCLALSSVLERATRPSGPGG